MLRKFSITDKLLMLSAFLSLVFAEISWFQGQHEAAAFVGIWVPSILAFGMYLKIIKNS